MSFDVAVIGLGAMGSAAACHLARRGLRVLGIDLHAPPHDRGSSHGRTRVIRQAYFEHPDYVPLLLRAGDLWRDLERESGRELLRRTGALMIGPGESPVVRGSLESARAHALPHRLLSNAELRREHPALRPREGDVALWEGEAGALYPEDCVQAHLDLARRHGAELRFGEKAGLNDRLAPRVVVTAGPWMPALLPAWPLQVERQVMFWFDPPPGAAPVPLLLWDYEGRHFYTVPDVRGDGVKVAFHHGGEVTDPDRVRREVGDAEVAEMRRLLGRTIPALDLPPRRAATCLYTNTPDGHFAIGLLPGRPGVAVASACSGHGFKFSSVVGEILADLVIEGRTRHRIALFDPARLGGHLS